MPDTLTVPANAVPFISAAAIEANMTCRQAAILALIDANPGCGIGAVARTLALPPPVVSRAVDKMLLLGLLTRVTSDEDRRRVVLTTAAR